MTGAYGLLIVTLAAGSMTSKQAAVEIDAVHEAAFRYMFYNNGSRGAKFYCLRLYEGDPSDSLIHRLSNSTLPVKKHSQCTSSVKEGVRDPGTGERGAILYLKALRWKSSSKAELDGGYWEGGLSSSGDTYFLRKKGSAWSVVKEKTHWVS